MPGTRIAVTSSDRIATTSGTVYLLPGHLRHRLSPINPAVCLRDLPLHCSNPNSSSRDPPISSPQPHEGYVSHSESTQGGIPRELSALSPIMSRIYALLLLAEPPQSTAQEDLHLALEPALSAVIDKLARLPPNQANARIFLDIALPITRLVHDVSSLNELRQHVNSLLTGIYQLLDSVTSNSPPQHNAPEVAIVLLHEKKPVTNDESGAAVNSSAEVLPLAVQDFEDFARCARPWSRIFQVDSPQGDAIYRRLRAVTRSSILTELHEKVTRLPAGIQMYIPPTSTLRDQALEQNGRGRGASHQHVSIDAQADRSLAWTEKVKLTMELMNLTKQGPSVPLSDRAAAGSLSISVTSGQDGKAAVVDFLASILGAEIEASSASGLVEKGTWETNLSDGTRLSVSSSRTQVPEITKTGHAQVTVVAQDV